MNVVLTEEADRDLEETVSYLLERNPGAAADLIDKVFDLAQRFADGMFDGPWEQISHYQVAAPLWAEVAGTIRLAFLL